MSGYMPKVGERFRWNGLEFERVAGQFVEQSILDERAYVLFPVVYRSGKMEGAAGLMNVADHKDFEFHTFCGQKDD